jgi:2-iminobutanoate/2-iminopropanoate deaminase
MPRKIIHPKSVHSTAGVGYSHVSRVGDTLYIAGQIALDRGGQLVGKGDIELQAQQVYANLSAILEELGGGLDDIVKMTTFLTDRAHLDGFRRVRNCTFSEPFPPNTLLFVSGLAQPDYLIEIEAIAVLSRASASPEDAGDTGS